MLRFQALLGFASCGLIYFLGHPAFGQMAGLSGSPMGVFDAVKLKVNFPKTEDRGLLSRAL